MSLFKTLGIAVMCGALAGSASATTWHVDPFGTGDAPTIQAAIDSAAAGDTVEVACGTYSEHGIPMKSGVVLRSESGDPACAIVDAGDAGRCFSFSACDSTTVMEGLTCTNGDPGVGQAGGVILVTDGSPRFRSCHFTSGYVHGIGPTHGGGIYIQGSISHPLLDDCTLEGNTVWNGDGGAIYAAGAAVTLIDCIVSGNSAGAGAGVFAGRQTLIDCVISDNSATFGAGTLPASGSTYTRCRFMGNSAASAGGATYVYNGSSLDLVDCLFDQNSAGLNGSAVFAFNAVFTMTGCTLVRNSGSNQVFVDQYGTATLDRSVIAFSTLGSALSCGSGTGVTLSVTCCDFFGNPGGDWGGCEGNPGENGNFAADPRFCNVASGDFTLEDASPCLPGQHPDGAVCGLIGAYGQGCLTPSYVWVLDPPPDTVTVGAAGDLTAEVLYLGERQSGRASFLELLSLQGLVASSGPATENPDSTYTLPYLAGLAIGLDSVVVRDTNAVSVPDTLPVYVTYAPDRIEVATNSFHIQPGDSVRVRVSILDAVGARVPDENQPFTVTSLAGLGTVGAFVAEPDTSYAAWYVAAAVGTDTLEAYDPDCAFAVRDSTTIDVLATARIASVLDVPDDQGGQVRVTWAADLRDTVSADPAIVEYVTWRRIDEEASAAVWTTAIPLDAALPMLTAARTADPADAAAPPLLLDAGFLWEPVGPQVPAMQWPAYASVVPTLGDSTITGGQHWSVFFVSAHTADPHVHYSSPPDSGWSTDDLAPAVPGGLALASDLLSWDDPVDGDFAHFSVLGSETGDPGDAVLVAHTVDPWLDVGEAPWPWYHATATDFSGNESGAASLENPATGVATAPIVPDRFALYPPRPNPSGGVTTIAFDVPEAGHATVRIVDVTGRVVRTLVVGSVEPGRYAPRWDGRDAAGRATAAGMYFVQMRAGEFEEARKIVRLR